MKSLLIILVDNIKLIPRLLSGVLLCNIPTLPTKNLIVIRVTAGGVNEFHMFKITIQLFGVI